MFKGSVYYFRLCWNIEKGFPIALVFQALLYAAKTVMLVVLPKYIIGALFVMQDKQQAVYFLALYVTFLFCISVLHTLCARFISIRKNIAFQRFQMELGKKLMQVAFEQLETPAFLDLKQKAERFVYSGGYGFGVILEESIGMLGKVISLIGISAIIVTLNPFLIVAVIVIVVLNVLVFAKTNKIGIRYRMEQSMQERRIQYYTEKMTDFHYAREMRNFNLSAWFLDKYNAQIKTLSTFYTKIANTQLLNGMFNAFTFTVQLILSYVILIRDVFTNALNVSNFTMYLASIATFAATLSEIIRTGVELSQFNHYFKAFEAYMNMPSMHNVQGLKPALPAFFTIEFQNVSFKYGSAQKYALRHVTVSFKNTERIAVIGENGAGKSTFVKLLMRLYEPTEGTILINGINIKAIDYEHYQSWFAAVFQDFKLFSFSIKDNITFGTDTDETTKRELMRITEAVGLKEIADRLEKGLDTLVYRDFDDAGFSPSGGEGQKIAIARAAYKNAPIVILDEPTAALDPMAESTIYEQFDTFFKDKCSLYISHRMAVTAFSDRVLVFDQGSLIQDDTPAVLLQQEGKYKELYMLQARLYNNAAE